MDFAIDLTDGFPGMTYEPAETIMNNVYLSLMIERGSLFVNPEFGSRLHLLRRAKNTANTEILAREYCREALQWLLDSGRATDIQIESERDRTQDLHRLKLRVVVTQTNGRAVTFETFVEVV
ncbi:MAG: phage GP46 family protein [Pseudomonadota bacterium]